MVIPDLFNYQATWNSTRRYLGDDVDPVLAYLLLMHTGGDLEAFFAQFFERYDLSEGRFAVLMRLLDDPEQTLAPSQLALSLGVTRATMTKLVESLERDGLVERHLDHTDRRVWLITLTDKARERLEEMLPPHFQKIKQLMGVLDKDECKQLITILLKLESHIIQQPEAENKR